MSVLVTGGAGYIGAHVVRLLLASGEEVVIADDLETGNADRNVGIPTLVLDLSHAESVAKLVGFMNLHRVDAVIHFAARKQVAESVARPEWYYQQNVGGLANVIQAMRVAEVDTIVFSSSAAVYGMSQGGLVAEASVCAPINPYGATKLVGEWLLESATTAHSLRACSLRYFNVAGAGWPELGDTAVLNLVPMVFEKIDLGEPPLVFGNGYETPDGTCIRDYVHVMDLAEAHIVALDHLRAGSTRHEIYNVGTGRGSSVLDVITMIKSISGRLDLVPSIRPPRPGDPAVVVADPTRLRVATGWAAKRGIVEIIESAWQSHRLLKS